MKKNSGAQKYNDCYEKFTRGIKGRFEQAEKRITAHKARPMKFILSEEQKENRVKKT